MRKHFLMCLAHKLVVMSYSLRLEEAGLAFLSFLISSATGGTFPRSLGLFFNSIAPAVPGICFPGGFAQSELADVMGSLTFVLLADCLGGVVLQSKGCCSRLGLGRLPQQSCLQDGIQQERWTRTGGVLWSGVNWY